MNNVSSVNIALRRFLNNHGNISTERSPKSGLCYTLNERLQGSFYYTVPHIALHIPGL